MWPRPLGFRSSASRAVKRGVCVCVQGGRVGGIKEIYSKVTVSSEGSPGRVTVSCRFFFFGGGCTVC